MIIGLSEIIAHPTCGIPEKHFKAIAQVAKDYTVVVGMRSVSRLAKHWIEEGYPSKSFVIKNKTGRIGPCQGLIAVDPMMGRTSASPSLAGTPTSSKDEGDQTQQSQDPGAKYTAELNYALAKDDTLKMIPLVLSKTDLYALERVTILPDDNGNPDNPNDYRLSWDDDSSAQVRSAFARYDPATEKYKIEHENGESILVLGKLITNARGEFEELPVTADYDLLVVCPTFRDFAPGLGQKDHTPLRTQSLNSEAFKKALDKDLKSSEALLEDPKGGNWSDRIRNVVNAINQKIADLDVEQRSAVSKGLEMVHHNAEFSNPFASALSGSLPATIFLPEPIDLSKFSGVAGTCGDCVLIETPEELTQLREYLRENGYYWPANVNLNEEVPVFPAVTVKKIQGIIQRQLSDRSLLLAMQQQNQQREEDSDSDISKQPNSGPG